MNTYTTSNQSNPSICGLASGGFVICWTSEDQDEKGFGICGQLFDNTIKKVGNEFKINSSSIGDQTYPKICGFGDSNFVVCWQNPNWNNSSFKIYTKLFNNKAEVIIDKFLVNTDTSNFVIGPQITQLSNENFIIAWINEQTIYAQIFDSLANKTNSELELIAGAEGVESFSITDKADGGFIISWAQYEENSGGVFDVYAQIFNNAGNSISEKFMVNTYTSGHQENPSVSTLSTDRFIICWSSYGQDGNSYGIFGQIFLTGGTKYGGEFQANSYIHDLQVNSCVTNIADERFLVCWDSFNQNGDNIGIYSQLFNNDGYKQGVEFRINTFISGSQAGASICGLLNERFVVCWESYMQDGSGFGIYAKYYLNDPIIHNLKPFSILDPAHDITTNNINPKFKWYRTNTLHINFPWKIEYKLYLDDNNDFMHPQIISGIYDTTFVLNSLIPGTTYWWKVLAKNIENDSLWSSETNGFFVSHDATGIKPQNPNNKSLTFELYANYPNPFNPETTIKYNLPADKSVYKVKVKIYGALGQFITTLIDEL